MGKKNVLALNEASGGSIMTRNTYHGVQATEREIKEAWYRQESCVIIYKEDRTRWSPCSTSRHDRCARLHPPSHESRPPTCKKEQFGSLRQFPRTVNASFSFFSSTHKKRRPNVSQRLSTGAGALRQQIGGV